MVEDDPNIRDSVAELLREHALPVATAEDGAKALEIIAGLPEPPRLVLLDLVMPVMNGWQFLEHRETDPKLREIPVVIMTVALDASAGLPGIAGYLRKPFSEAQLIDTVQRISAGHDAPPVAPKAAQTTGAILRVLLIEEDEGDALTTRAHLDHAKGFQFDTHHVRTLAEALTPEVLAAADVILLDLGAPEESSLARIEKTLRHAPGIPLVVLTAPKAEDLREAAIRRGAQDSLDRDQRSPELLSRALHYAVERQRLHTQLEEAKEVAFHERERRGLARWGQTRSAVAAEVLGNASLKRATPDSFKDFVARFRHICDRAVEDLGHQRESSQLKELQGLAERLAGVRAGPGDIVDIYQEVLSTFKGDRSEIASARREEARLMLIGLLGYVLAAYRLHVIQPT